MALNMNLSLSALPWRAQLGTSAGLAVAGVAAFWYFYASPLREDVDGRLAALSKVQAEITRGQATARRLPQFRKDAEALESQLTSLKTQLPEERDVADLLRRVQAMATESNLTIRGFTPQAVTKKDLHAEWPIGLQIEGTYHDVGAFLDRVGKFPRIINVGNIHIAAREGQSGSATVTADCTATAFVLVNPEEAPAAAPARGRGAGPAATAKAS